MITVEIEFYYVYILTFVILGIYLEETNFVYLAKITICTRNK